MTNYELSYATPHNSLLQRTLVRSIESLSGRKDLLPIYHRWRDEVAGRNPCMMQEALRMIGTRLEINAKPDWASLPSDRPLVIVANHPFGIADGIALLALAEHVGRPYRALMNSDFMRVPELAAISLPIDFSGTRAAVQTNLASRAEARRLLKQGVTICVFPAGGVATAERPRGQAEDLPWKHFASRLIELTEASVLPVYFEGQNSALFHLVSRYSLTLRLSLLVAEFRHAVGGVIKANVGDVVPFTELTSIGDRRLLTEELHVRVHRLAPGAEDAPRHMLVARPAEDRRRYPWDKP